MGNWILGFDKQIITPDDYLQNDYYSAGYAGGCRCTDVLDDMYVRSLYLDDSSGKGGVFLSVVDCVGMSNTDVLAIRDILKSFTKRVKSRGVNILFTHCHSAVDTQGLWGKLPKSGRVPHYMNSLKIKIANSIIASYKNAKLGKLFVGDIKTSGLLVDTRAPMVFDDRLTRITFKPDDLSAPVTLIHFAVHPELLGGNNPLISADFPAYMGKRIEESTSGEFAYFTGAIGGLITCPGLDDIFEKRVDPVENCKEYGYKVAEFALSVNNDVELDAKVDYVNKKINIPVSNAKFVLAKKCGLINTSVIKVSGKPYKYMAISELGYLSLGNYLRIMLVPGELYSEIAMGGYLSAKYSATGREMSGGTIFEMMPDGKKLVFGLCNDEVGYIIPDNDFYIDKKLPYIVDGIDRFGEKHYEETNSIGVFAAQTILSESREIFNEMRCMHE